MELSEKEIKQYLNKNIDKVFACLKIYEDIENGDATYSQLSTYIDRLVIEFKGFDILYETPILISLISTLSGISQTLEELNHAQMKSYIFYCISIIKKIRL